MELVHKKRDVWDIINEMHNETVEGTTVHKLIHELAEKLNKKGV